MENKILFNDASKIPIRKFIELCPDNIRITFINSQNEKSRFSKKDIR